MAIDPRITPEQQAEENSVQFGLIGDSGLLVMLVLTGALGGSLTMLAEAIRGGLMALIELFSLIVMRRIHRGQLADLFVLATLTLAALSTDEEVVAWADAVGSLFVAAFIVANALGMLVSGLADLLDRSAGRTVREAIDRALARHAGDFHQLARVRSRRSGRVVFIELALRFDPGLSIAEVNRRIDVLRRSLGRDIEHSDISVLALSGPD